MKEYLRLADACENATGKDRDLELTIWRLDGGQCPEGMRPLAWLYCYTESVNAALKLCDRANVSNLMNEAMVRLSGRYSLHMSQWPENVDYGETLARFVTAAALRWRYEQWREINGLDVDLTTVELPDFALRLADRYLRLSPGEIDASQLDKRPMARVWKTVTSMLVTMGTLKAAPADASDEMVAAGQAAYDGKIADTMSPSPTEHPADGGGPIGYAWRAMANAYERT